MYRMTRLTICTEYSLGQSMHCQTGFGHTRTTTASPSVKLTCRGDSEWLGRHWQRASVGLGRSSEETGNIWLKHCIFKTIMPTTTTFVTYAMCEKYMANTRTLIFPASQASDEHMFPTRSGWHVRIHSHTSAHLSLSLGFQSYDVFLIACTPWTWEFCKLRFRVACGIWQRRLCGEADGPWPHN